jgi:transcriptional regulator NrdR family protein
MTCNHVHSGILESRICSFIRFKDKAQITVRATRRRRFCKSCGYRWTTYEVEDSFLDQFCRPPGEDEESAIRKLKILKHKLASLIS